MACIAGEDEDPVPFPGQVHRLRKRVCALQFEVEDLSGVRAQRGAAVEKKGRGDVAVAMDKVAEQSRFRCLAGGTGADVVEVASEGEVRDLLESAQRHA